MRQEAGGQVFDTDFHVVFDVLLLYRAGKVPTFGFPYLQVFLCCGQGFGCPVQVTEMTYNMNRWSRSPSRWNMELRYNLIHNTEATRQVYSSRKWRKAKCVRLCACARYHAVVMSRSFVSDP